MTMIQRRTGMLLALAALGAAGMFLGADRWFGVDIGATGAAVLYGALWLFVVHLSRHADAAFPVDASLAERQAWVGLVFTALIAVHFARLLAALPGLGAQLDQLSNPVSRRFAINLGMLIFGWIVVGGVLRSRNTETVQLDERDLRIQHGAGRFASGLMSMMIIGLVVLLASLPEQSRMWMRPFMVGIVLIGLLIASSLAQIIVTVLRYRCGRA